MSPLSNSSQIEDGGSLPAKNEYKERLVRLAREYLDATDDERTKIHAQVVEIAGADGILFAREIVRIAKQREQTDRQREQLAQWREEEAVKSKNIKSYIYGATSALLLVFAVGALMRSCEAPQGKQPSAPVKQPDTKPQRSSPPQKFPDVRTAPR